MTSPRYKRKVRNMLVDKRFQLKYTALVLVLGLAIFGVLGALYFNERKTSSELLEVGETLERSMVHLPEGAVDSEYVSESLQELEAEMAPEVKTRDTTAVYFMLGSVAFLVLFLAAAGIYVTHKMVGPLYAIEMFMRAVQEGRWSSIRPLRKGDEFTRLSDEFMRLADAVRGRHEEELPTLRKLLDEHQANLTPEMAKAITDLVARKESYIDR
jgi:HAMP domain-containing protein